MLTIYLFSKKKTVLTVPHVLFVKGLFIYGLLLKIEKI